MNQPHRPQYLYCPDPEPEDCCGHINPIAIKCAECGEGWPCTTKRSHNSPEVIRRTEIWVESRIGRSPRGHA